MKRLHRLALRNDRSDPMNTQRHLRSAICSICLLGATLVGVTSGAAEGSEPSRTWNSGAGIGQQSSQNGDRAATIDGAQLEKIATWLVRNFKLPPSKQMPTVKFVDSEQLIQIRYGDDQASQDVSSARHTGGGEDGNSIVALYDARGPVIYVTKDWRGDNSADVSVLVHEMVHHLQHAGQLHFDCPEARERMAYLAQDRWLAGNGKSLAEMFGVDGFTVMARSMCGR
jgi:Domain of unknown function (DUF6647)